MTWGWLTCFRRLNSDSRSRSSLGEAFSEIQGNSSTVQMVFSFPKHLLGPCRVSAVTPGHDPVTSFTDLQTQIWERTDGSPSTCAFPVFWGGSSVLSYLWEMRNQMNTGAGFSWGGLSGISSLPFLPLRQCQLHMRGNPMSQNIQEPHIPLCMGYILERGGSVDIKGGKCSVAPAGNSVALSRGWYGTALHQKWLFSCPTYAAWPHMCKNIRTAGN